MSKTKLLTQYDLIEAEFFKDDIDCSFLYEYISEAYKEDPLIKVLSDDVFVNGERCSRVCVIDPSDNTIHVGASEMGSMPYPVEEDMSGVNVIFDFVHKSNYTYGECVFPDVPVAKDGFPENQHFRPYEGYMLETIFARKGFRLLNPSLGCFKELSHTFVMYTNSGLNGMEPMTDEGFYFTPYRDDVKNKKNVLGMQFNPFHPMSIRMLKTAEWFGNVMKGYYSYRSRLMPFMYDLEDKRYRIYSEDWRQILGKVSGSLEVFDLVSSFKSNDILKLEDKGFFIEPFVVEPLIIYSTPIEFPYSKIGPNMISVEKGVSDVISVPYSRAEFPVHAKAIAYKEITEDCTLYPGDALYYGDETYYFQGSTLQSDHIFIRVIEREAGIFFRAFMRRNKDNYKSGKNHFFFEIEGVPFLSFPRNRWGAIVYPYNCQTLIDIVRAEDFVHEFLPIYINPPEFDIRFVEDDTLIYEEKKEITISESDLYKQHYLQGDTGVQSRMYGCYCHFCGEIVTLEGVAFDRKGVITYIHKACKVCPCGAPDDISYKERENGFRCDRPVECSYQRECFVCHSHVSYKGLNCGVFVHKDCVQCDCGQFQDLRVTRNDVVCKCRFKKNYDTVNSRNKNKRMIIK